MALYGDNTVTVAVPVIYRLNYFGANIPNQTHDITVTRATIELPAVDSDFNNFVAAANVFGIGENSIISMDEISELIS